MVDDERALLLPALFFAGLGHGDRRVRAGRIGDRAARSACSATADWLLTKEVRRKGDWSVKRPNTEPSGWYFEFANEFYPDIDDTAMVLLALARTRKAPTRRRSRPATKRARQLAARRCSRRTAAGRRSTSDNNWKFLSNVPFADHNAMLDPTCPDITGRVLEALCAHGVARDHPAVRRGVEY